MSLFRIDSLVWQIGESVYQFRHNRATAEAAIGNILEGYGAALAVVPSVAAEQDVRAAIVFAAASAQEDLLVAGAHVL